MVSYTLDVSIIIPVQNEEGNIPPLANEIEEVLSLHSWRWECIWINDGSTDRTLDVLQNLINHRSNHRCVSLSENVGQSMALWHGFQASRGELLITLDGDGQNDPADIPKIVQCIHKHQVDVANGYRLTRKDTWLRRVSSMLANHARNQIIGHSVRDIGCSLRAMRRECVQNLPLFTGMHRFLPTLIYFQNYRLEEIPVQHRSRKWGTSKYTIGKRFWVGIFDLLGVLWLRFRGFSPIRPMPELQADNLHEQQKNNEPNTNGGEWESIHQSQSNSSPQKAREIQPT